MLDWIVILLSAALSVVLPVAIIYVRQTVKSQRQDVINDLAAPLPAFPAYAPWCAA